MSQNEERGVCRRTVCPSPSKVGESTKLLSLCSVGAGGWKERLLAVHRNCLFYGLETSTMSCAGCDHSS
ncbi:unnamed protein product [Macrosiphum euphorbiae]|uniref:Uncharacterized protein n=1 Tax=Macrosiphum euphorbiae TaxID=13131 RepID=A0AAV0W244_9HEMI|nr:unnamed protein product [Macrosiphum euphorbiae]